VSQRPILTVIAGIVCALGGVWLAAFIWNAGNLRTPQPYAPHVIGSLFASLTAAAMVDRQPFRASIVVVSGALAVFLVLYVAGKPLPWAPAMPAWPYLGIVAAGSLATTPTAFLIRRRIRVDRSIVWFWISVLLALGCIGTAITATGNADDHKANALMIFAMLGAPVLAGALCQLVAPRRMIWICGSGTFALALVALDRMIRDGDFEVGVFVGIAGGMGIFVVLGAGGARLAWRLFRNNDVRDPRRVDLPRARVD
jgi:hypothetical protein